MKYYIIGELENGVWDDKRYMPGDYESEQTVTKM